MPVEHVRDIRSHLLIKLALLDRAGAGPADLPPVGLARAADVPLAADLFFNHGQCCVAGSRLFVQEDRFDEVVNGVAEIAKGIKLGPGMESGTQMGPLVSEER